MALEDPASTAAPHDCPATEPAEPSRASPRLVILILISVLAVLPVNMILPSLPGIAASFHVDPATVNLAVAAYAIATAVVEIVCGAMSDRFGRRPVATVSVAVFIGASIGCALAPGIALFLFFRIAQASIDACFSLVLVTIRERSTDRAAASRFGYLGMGWAVAPVLGPIIGGAVDAAFGWRAVFALLAALGAVALGLCRLELERGTPVRSRVDRSYPTAWRSLLCSIRFWSLTLCMMFSMATFYLFLGEAPLILSWAFDAAAPQLGFFMAATPAGFVIGSYLAGRHASRMPLGTTLILARLTTCAGLCAALALSITGAGGMPGFFVPCMFIGIGNGLTMPVGNARLLSLRPDLAATALGLATAIRIGGGALVASCAGVAVSRWGSVSALIIAMLACALAALLMASCAAYLDRKHQQDAV